MKKIYVTGLLTLMLSLFASEASSQVTASFYTNDANSKIALGYNFNDKLWTDLRIYSGTNIDNITPELVLNYNFIRKDMYDTYVGGGVILNDINGIVVPLGLAIKPLENVKNLSINLELNPLYEIDYEDVYIRAFIGIRYKL